MKINIDKLIPCLNKYPVILAYIFGSVSQDRTGPLSDIDIAVMLSSELNKSERFDLKLKMTSELTAVLGKNADMVILNDAPVSLSFEVIQQGRLILCRDRSLKLDFEVGVMSGYLDRRYYDKRHSETVLRKISSQGLLS